MSILIKGMEMPKTCNDCGLLIEHDRVTVNVNEMTVSEYCPLVEIPTPH